MKNSNPFFKPSFEFLSKNKQLFTFIFITLCFCLSSPALAQVANRNVGIGTTEPCSQLDVVDNPLETTITVGRTPNNIKSQFRTVCLDNSDIILTDINVDFDILEGIFTRQNDNFSAWCSGMRSTFGGADSFFDISFGEPGSGIVNWESRFRIDESGNVGIGTTTPDSRLQIVDNPIETSITIGQTPNNMNTEIRTLCLDGWDWGFWDFNVRWDPFQQIPVRQNENFTSWCMGMSSTPFEEASTFGIASAFPGQGQIEWFNTMQMDPFGNMNVSGFVTAQGFNEFSDARFKKDVTELNQSLEKIKQLRGVSYHFDTTAFPKKKFSEEKRMGFIAQEVQEVFPNLVKETKEGYLSVNYTAVIPVLTEAVKELDAENQSLREEVETLKSRMEEIEALMEKLIDKK